MNTTEEKINNLIVHHTEARLEVNELLRELNAVDLSKVSQKEKREVREAIIRVEEESTFRGIMLDDLKNLL